MTDGVGKHDAVAVLVARTNRLETLRPQVPPGARVRNGREGMGD